MNRFVNIVANEICVPIVYLYAYKNDISLNIGVLWGVKSLGI